MLRFVIGGLAMGLAACGLSLSAAAQGDFEVWERELYASATLVFAPGLSDDSAIGEGENALYEVSAGGTVERILESGVRIGFRGTLRLQNDHDGRPGFSGNFPGNGPAGPRGALTGFTPGAQSDQTGPRGSLETAHLYVEGGYGEISAGRDLGIAARFHEGDVGVFSHARAVNPYLDASGRSLVRTRHDLTGPSAKFSYTSPRIIGVKAGISFTPDADARGLDRNLEFDGAGIASPDLENALEIGLNGSRRLRESGIRLRGALSWSTAELGTPDGGTPADAGRVETLSLGGEIERDEWRIGVNALLSDDGLKSGEYSAFGAGVSRRVGDWTFSGEIGDARADAIEADGFSYSLGAARNLGKRARIAIGYQQHEADTRSRIDPDSPSYAGQSQGLVVEITLKP